MSAKSLEFENIECLNMEWLERSHASWKSYETCTGEQKQSTKYTGCQICKQTIKDNVLTTIDR